jgi:squalene synthase HpnC
MRVPKITLREARAFCRQFTRRHSENFSVATLFLPRTLVPHFYAVYAYCRFADDLGDESGDPAIALERLSSWREELLRTYAGAPDHPIMVALLETIRRFAIPQKPFLDLLIAFEQDQSVKRYRTYEDLLGYCEYSANPVGRILLSLFECLNEETAALADSICTGLQLTNFWQDVSRDYAIGRVYLPKEDMAQFGYSEADLRSKRFTPAFAELMRFEVGRARELLQKGLPLVDRVPPSVRLDVELFASGGLAILNKIERQSYNVVEHRPRLSRFEKAALIASAVGRKWRRRLWPVASKAGR